MTQCLPYSRSNENQYFAIKTHYNPLIKKHGLSPCTIPNSTDNEVKIAAWPCLKIIKELEESQANTIILLGDQPIKHWLSNFTDKRKLADFGSGIQSYGKPHEIDIHGTTYKVIPLIHPRPAGNLDKSSKFWNELHTKWIKQTVR